MSHRCRAVIARARQRNTLSCKRSNYGTYALSAHDAAVAALASASAGGPTAPAPAPVAAAPVALATPADDDDDDDGNVVAIIALVLALLSLVMNVFLIAALKCGSGDAAPCANPDQQHKSLNSA